MVSLAEVQNIVLKLSVSDRAQLAADLLDSLPSVMDDDDQGIAEGLRRAEEMDRDPATGLTHHEFIKALGREP